MGRNRRANRESPPEPEPRRESTGEAPVARALLAGMVTSLFVLRPLYPSESVAAEGDGLPVVMLWLLVLTLWAILVARGSLVKVRFSWPDVAVALLVLWHSIAALWAVAYESPRPALNMLWEWLGLAIAFFLARQAFPLGLHRRAVGAVMVALAVVVSIYGLYQYSIGLPATRAYYDQASEKELREAGVWFPEGSPEREAYRQRLESLEPMATFALTNSLAGFLAPWAIVALGISAVFARQLSIKQRLAVASLLVPLGLCLLLTKSRSAFLACACGAAAVAAIWWFGRKQARAGRALLALGTVAVLILSAILGAVMVGGLDVEVLSEAPKSLGYRLQYWQASAAMIRDVPVMGCGPGNFKQRYTAYKLPEASEEITDPHNFIIEIWATAGTPALLALLAVGAAFCLCLFRSPRQATDEPAPTPGELDTGRTDSRAILLGAAIGILLSLPVGAMGVAPPGWFIPLAGLPLGALVLATLWPWVARGDDSAILWAAALSVLLINLLFAGGISYPGVATGLWLLAALALNASRCGERLARPWVGTLVFAGSLGSIAACYITGYSPTLVARTQIDRALAGVSAGDPETLPRFLKAVAADPWAFEPRMYLADYIHQQWLARPNAETSAEFDRAVEETLARVPRAASLRVQFAKAYLECYGRSRNQAHLDHAIQLFESAAALYPNSCHIRADLAEAYLLRPDLAAYERERDEALRLDNMTPHLDKRLPPEQRQRLSRTTLAPDMRARVPE